MNGFGHESPKNKTKEWYTPRYIFESLGVSFDLDPCSPGKDIVPWVTADAHYTLKHDGLSRRWFGNVWMNPPYGRQVSEWTRKFANHGNGIALLFARTETKWFLELSNNADAFCFINKRVNFVRQRDAESYKLGDKTAKESPGAPSVLVAFGEDNVKALADSGLGITMVKIGA